MTTKKINDYGAPVAPDTFRIERLLPGPIERVWAYLTESDKRAQWLAAGDTELRDGGRIEFHFHHADLTPHTEITPDKYKPIENGISFTGTVLRCEPPRLLSYRWGENEGDVTFELIPQGDDVLLVVTHARVADRTAMVSFASGWHVHLGILADKLAGREPAPFWATHAKLEADYAKRLAQ